MTINFTDTMKYLYSPHYGFMTHYYPGGAIDLATTGGGVRKWRGLDTTSTHRDSIRPLKNEDAADAVDSAYHVYLKNENGFLSFTVKTDSQRNEKDWTNGYPTKFTKDSLYYRIDTMMLGILPVLFVNMSVETL